METPCPVCTCAVPMGHFYLRSSLYSLCQPQTARIPPHGAKPERARSPRPVAAGGCGSGAAGSCSGGERSAGGPISTCHSGATSVSPRRRSRPLSRSESIRSFSRSLMSCPVRRQPNWRAVSRTRSDDEAPKVRRATSSRPSSSSESATRPIGRSGSCLGRVAVSAPSTTRRNSPSRDRALSDIAMEIARSM